MDGRYVRVMSVMIMSSALWSARVHGQRVATSVQPENVSKAVITLDVKDATLENVLRTISQQAGLKLFFSGKGLPAKLVTLQVRNVHVADAFAQVLSGTGMRATIDAGLVVLSSDRDASASSGGITGVITDAKTRQPLRGATITLDENTKGVLTSDDGHFLFPRVPAGAHTVHVRLLGYIKTTKVVTVADDQTVSADVVLETSISALDQVVVTGTVIPTELKAVPNAITVITAKQIEERGITKIDQLFRGDVPGLFAANMGSYGGAQLDEVTMYSRGATAITVNSANVSFGTNPIKTYVDGIEMADPRYLSQIDPKSIERIEILTGPQASTIYGSNAINGVMQIFTKRGTSNAPQLTLNLLSGFVQNNFSTALTPQHNYDAQLSGVEGRLSYNAGGSWDYMGAWTPSKQLARMGGFGGTRLELPTSVGRVSADFTLRRTLTQSFQRGDPSQIQNEYRDIGYWSVSGTTGLTSPNVRTLNGQTLGLTMSYAPASWWSHEFGWGSDVSDGQQRYLAAGYTSPSDTLLSLIPSYTDRRSLRYTTTARVPVTSLAQLTLTAGADSWQSLQSSFTARSSPALTGTLTGSTSVSRRPGHNTGAFAQSQLGLHDQLFFTYGLRIEKNPTIGDKASVVPGRYGVAYTQDFETPFGALTTKLRASYGRSIRPPAPTRKDAIANTDVTYAALYGPFNRTLASPELEPEYQQGGEGGIELYLGTRGSLVVTRYNQTINHLIGQVTFDSIRTLLPNPPLNYYSSLDANGYGYTPQFEYLNIASIRNAGWEIQGNANGGPLTVRGTYSWTRSRVIGVTPKYAAQFATSPLYQTGQQILYVPEHTWELGVTYVHAGSTVALTVAGVGAVTNQNNDFYLAHLSGNIRLPQDVFHLNSSYTSFNSPYALADLQVSHRLRSNVDALLQMQNLGDRYVNEQNAANASLGRQVKVGARVRTQ